MVSRTALLCCFCLALCGAVRTAYAEETITLTDGRTLSGTIEAEDDKQVILKQADGEQRAILKSHIAAIAKTHAPKPTESAAKTERPVTDGKPLVVMQQPGSSLSGANAERIALIKELGAPRPEVRVKATEAIIKDKAGNIPVMLAMLHPKQPTNEFTRIGILRALVSCVPLSDQAASTIGYDALYDPYPEARREACQTIRVLADDRSLREIMKSANSANSQLQRAIAVALHEIDDDRVLMALIRALPQPSVTANNGEPNGLDKPAYNLPVGPGGARIPIFLPSGSVQGIAADLDSPAVPLLKMIAGKDLGNLGYGWFNWYREKIGEIGKEERDAYQEKRSVLNRGNR